MAGARHNPDTIQAIQQTYLDVLYRPCTLAANHFNPEHHPGKYKKLMRSLRKLIKKKHPIPDGHIDRQPAWLGRTWQSIIPKEYRKHHDHHQPPVPEKTPLEKAPLGKAETERIAWALEVLDTIDMRDLAQCLQQIGSMTLEQRDGDNWFLAIENPSFHKIMKELNPNAREPEPELSWEKALELMKPSGKVTGVFHYVWPGGRWSGRKSGNTCTMSPRDWLFLKSLKETQHGGIEMSPIWLATISLLPDVTQHDVVLARGLSVLFVMEELFLWSDTAEEYPCYEKWAAIMKDVYQQLASISQGPEVLRFRNEYFRLQSIAVKGQHNPQMLTETMDELAPLLARSDEFGFEARNFIASMIMVAESRPNPNHLQPEKVDTMEVLEALLRLESDIPTAFLLSCLAVREAGRQKIPDKVIALTRKPGELVEERWSDDERGIYDFSVTYAMEHLGVKATYDQYLLDSFKHVPVFYRTMLRHLGKEILIREGFRSRNPSKEEQEAEKQHWAKLAREGIDFFLHGGKPTDEDRALTNLFISAVGIQRELKDSPLIKTPNIRQLHDCARQFQEAIEKESTYLELYSISWLIKTPSFMLELLNDPRVLANKSLHDNVLRFIIFPLKHQREIEETLKEAQSRPSE